MQVGQVDLVLAIFVPMVSSEVTPLANKQMAVSLQPAVRLLLGVRFATRSDDVAASSYVATACF